MATVIAEITVPRIGWVSDDEASGETAEVFAEIRAKRQDGKVTPLLRTMSLNPRFMKLIREANATLLSPESPLSPALYHMIAAHVSGLTKCHFCLSTHAWLLARLGEEFSGTALALRDGDLDFSDITPAERLLLDYVETLTKHAYRVTDDQVQGLRNVGWSEPQIAQATYVTAMYNFFIRLADAFDLQPPPGWDPDGVPDVLTRPD
jgi:uncharacterized peroxidase-related enzyme